MSDQDNGQVSTLQRPTTGDPEAWKAYWEAQGWSWRTEPEIDKERQRYLTERRAIVPNIEQGIYPFRDIKLTRADVEWLLVTHENGRGSVDWHDAQQQYRLGLDLRGANLCGTNLSHLPLARIRGGLNSDEWHKANKEQLNTAGVLMKEALLTGVHLEGAHLRYAHLEKANLKHSSLERAHFRGA